MPLIANPRMPFMSPPPLGLVRLFAAAATVPFCSGVITQTNGDCQGKKSREEKKVGQTPAIKTGELQTLPGKSSTQRSNRYAGVRELNNANRMG